MSKQNELADVTYSLSPQQYENIFNVYEDADIGYFFNLLRTVNFPEDLDPNTYDNYVIEPNDSWPLISWKVYNTVFLWWLICSTNRIQNPSKLPETGTAIKIIKIQYAKNILNDIQAE
jgi:hypothetical protein